MTYNKKDKRDNAMDQLRDTEYDGIQEYDNNLPNWWLATFYATVIFGIIYWFYFFITGAGESSSDRFARLYEAHQIKFAAKDNNANAEVTDDSLKALTKNSTALSGGKKVYDDYCASCHTMSGAGDIGPNLADRYWLHGPRPTDIHAVIVNGVVEKGMISWKPVLTSRQIQEVTAYIMTLEGTNPPNPKAPQGKKY